VSQGKVGREAGLPGGLRARRSWLLQVKGYPADVAASAAMRWRIARRRLVQLLHRLGEEAGGAQPAFGRGGGGGAGFGGNVVRSFIYAGGRWSWGSDDGFVGRMRVAQVTGSGTR